jgi:hypothetical protein
MALLVVPFTAFNFFSVFSLSRNRGVAVTQTNGFIVQFTTCYGPHRPSSRDLEGYTTID